jgi:hypothetical protein
MTQREAYNECVKMARENGWLAAYNALVEDGFDEATDFITLLKGWQ